MLDVRGGVWTHVMYSDTIKSSCSIKVLFILCLEIYSIKLKVHLVKMSVLAAKTCLNSQIYLISQKNCFKYSLHVYPILTLKPSYKKIIVYVRRTITLPLFAWLSTTFLKVCLISVNISLWTLLLNYTH